MQKHIQHTPTGKNYATQYCCTIWEFIFVSSGLRQAHSPVAELAEATKSPQPPNDDRVAEPAEAPTSPQPPNDDRVAEPAEAPKSPHFT
jgi:hypothetical protein